MKLSIVSTLYQSALCALGIFSFTVFYHWNLVYRDVPMTQQTAVFTKGKLAGVRSAPERVQAIEALLDYLSDKIKPKDYFLTYDDSMLLYYLTDTRPAVATTWITIGWDPKIGKFLVEDMIKRKKVPEYCVKMISPVWGLGDGYLSDYAIEVFVLNHYQKVADFFPFEVYRLKAMKE